MPEVVDLLNKVGFPSKRNWLSEGVKKAKAKASYTSSWECLLIYY